MREIRSNPIHVLLYIYICGLTKRLDKYIDKFRIHSDLSAQFVYGDSIKYFKFLKKIFAEALT